MKKCLTGFICFVCVMSAAAVFAEIKSLIKEYTYQASELDSKVSSRAIALEQVKRELLEELGTYVESATVVKDYQIEKDEIRTITAGVVQTKVLDEKWDGREYWLKAEVSADPEEVAASIARVKEDANLAEELAETRQEKEDALKEVEKLKQELADARTDQDKLAQYNQAVNQLQAADSFEQGTALAVAGDYEGAARAYDRTIELRPNDAKALFNRSIVYIFLGDYSRATHDLDRAMLSRPAGTNMYYQRASAYKDVREQRMMATPPQPSPWLRHPHRKISPSKEDPLQKYLDQKRAEYKLVRENPFQPKPRFQSPGRAVQIQPAVPGPATERSRKLETTSPDHLRQKGRLDERDASRQNMRTLQPPQSPVIHQPRRPHLYNRGQKTPSPETPVQQPYRTVIKGPQKPLLRDRDKFQATPRPQVLKLQREPLKKKTWQELQDERKSPKFRDKREEESWKQSR